MGGSDEFELWNGIDLSLSGRWHLLEQNSGLLVPCSLLWPVHHSLFLALCWPASSSRAINIGNQIHLFTVLRRASTEGA